MDGNTRGKSYNMQRVMELYESGMKPAEIANRLKINSVQSLRHAIERHKREKERTERIISEIAEEKQARKKAEDEKLENEAKQKETAERQKLIAKILPPNVGLFPYAIDIQTFKALEFVLKKQWNCDFYIDSETQEIYLPENIDPTDVRDELLLSGFYMKITNGPQYNKKPLKVRIMHDVLMSEIPLDAQKIDLFFPAVNEDAHRRLMHAFKLLITIGVMKIDSLSRISFSDQIGIDHVRGQISKLGYYGEICYNPLGTLHEMGKKVLGKHGSYLIIMENLEKAEIKEQILDIWGEFEVKALMNSILEDTVLDKELSLGDAVRPYLGKVFSLTVKSIGYRKVVVAPGFLGSYDIEEFDEGKYMDSLWSEIYDTISNYYVQLHENREKYKAEVINT